MTQLREDDFVEHVTRIIRDVLSERYVPQQKANLYCQIVADNNLQRATDLKKASINDILQRVRT
jgi:hypothetical protein